jgi:predicted small secreted protein
MKKSKLFLLVALLLGASLLVACGQTAAPAGNPVQAAVAPVQATVAPVAATVAPVTAVAANNSQSSGANSNPSGPDACTLLTKDDVSKVLGAPVDTATGSGLGGVCTYTSKNLKIDFTVAGHTGGAKAMATTLARLGDIALVVPGLGDQAFYNTDSANGLFVLKGDAEYLFNMSDVTYQPLDPNVVQATEKALAVQLLSNLH